MDIQIYDQISILRNCSKGKLRRAVSTRLGLKVVKIARNIVKLGVYAFLSNGHPIRWSNGHPNLWSNFNSEKLVKIETLLCIFARVGLKGGPNSLEHCKSWHARLFIKWASKLWWNFNSENLVKSETPSCGVAKVWLKGGENRFEHHKIRNALLSTKWASKSTIKF